MAGDVTYPVQVLREQMTELEAALSVCLADPGHKAVHKLRTQTRRVAAELMLLSQIPELPEHRDEADALEKQLKRLRRAAGEVRDFDVQRKLLDEVAEMEPTPAMEMPENGSRAEKAASNGSGKRSKRKGLAADAAEVANAENGSRPAISAVRKAAGELRDHLEKKREEAAADLLKLLKKRQAKATRAAQALLEKVGDREALAVPVESLLHHAGALLERDHVLERESVDALDEDELHTVRKAAKTARYLAETAPENEATRAAAEHFEAMQEAGGQWHDLLDLARASRRFLGKTHELTMMLATDRERKLALYRQALAADMRPAPKRSGKKQGAKGGPNEAVKARGSGPKPGSARAKKSGATKTHTRSAR